MPPRRPPITSERSGDPDEAGPPNRHARESAWRLLASLSCYFFLAGMLQSVVSLYGTRLSLGGLELGVTLALASAGLGFITDLPFAEFADRKTPWAPAGGGLLLSAVACLILLERSTITLIVGAFLFGIASSAIGNALLSWLSLGGSRSYQARVQGFNGSVQRLGAIGAAGVVGLALASHRLVLLPVAGVTVSLCAYALLRGVRRPVTTAMHPGQGSFADLLLGTYLRELRMLSRRLLFAAAITNLTINLLLLGTNAYVPIISGPHRAVVVTLSLIGRDAAAILTGFYIALTRPHLARPVVVGVITLLSAAVMAMAGLVLGNAVWLPLLCTAEGAMIGLLIVAVNLLAVDGADPTERTVGMAASILPGRIGLVLVPLGASVVFRQYGLQDVFYLLALCLLFASLTVLAPALALGGRRTPAPGSGR